MGIQIARASGSASVDVAIPRQCEGCKHTYIFHRRVVVFASGQCSANRREYIRQLNSSVANQVRVNAQEEAQKLYDKLTTNPKMMSREGVVCPRCGMFSSFAVARYFRDGEWNAMLGHLQNTAFRMTVSGFLSLALGWIFLVPFIMFASKFKSFASADAFQLFILFSTGGAMIASFWMGIWNVFLAFRARKLSHWFIEMQPSSNDEMLLHNHLTARCMKGDALVGTCINSLAWWDDTDKFIKVAHNFMVGTRMIGRD